MGGGSFIPKQGDWRFFDDVSPDTSMTALAAENVQPTLANNNDIVRLRVIFHETGAVNGELGYKIQYSLDESSWVDMGSSNHWNYANGAGIDDEPISTYLLGATDNDGIYTESNKTAGEAITKNDFHEFDFAIVPTSNVNVSDDYYFRVLMDTSDPYETLTEELVLDTSATHPVLTTAGVSNDHNSTSAFSGTGAVVVTAEKSGQSAAAVSGTDGVAAVQEKAGESAAAITGADGADAVGEKGGESVVAVAATGAIATTSAQGSNDKFSTASFSGTGAVTVIPEKSVDVAVAVSGIDGASATHEKGAKAVVDFSTGSGTEIVDEFTDDDATPLSDHDAKWTATNGLPVPKIYNNQATGLQWNHLAAYYDDSQGNDHTSQAIVKAKTTELTSAQPQRFVGVRATSSTYGYEASLVTISAGKYTKISLTKNGPWETDSTGTWAVDEDHKIRIEVSGSSPANIKVWVDDVLEIDHDDSTAPLTTGNPGLRWNSDGVTSEYPGFDDWTDQAMGAGGGSSISATSEIVLESAAGFSNTGAIAGTAEKAGEAASAVSGTGAIATTSEQSSVDKTSTAGFSATSVVAATHEKAGESVAAVSGSGAVAAIPEKAGDAVVAVIGSGTFTSTSEQGSIDKESTVGFSGTSGVTTTNEKVGESVSAVTGTVAISTISTQSEIRTSIVGISGSSTVDSSQEKAGESVVTVSGSDDVATVNEKSGEAAASISGSGGIAAVGIQEHSSSVAISGSGSVDATDEGAHTGATEVSGSGSCDVIPFPAKTGETGCTASGAVSVTAEKGVIVTVDFAASSAVDVTSYGAVAGDFELDANLTTSAILVSDVIIDILDVGVRGSFTTKDKRKYRISVAHGWRKAG